MYDDLPKGVESRWLAIRKAIRVALVVGPVLLLINNVDYFMRGDLPRFFSLKILLTFAVPFCVSLYSSLTYRPATEDIVATECERLEKQ